MRDLVIRLAGDAAVLAVLGDSIDIHTVERVWSLTAAVRRTMRVGVVDVVPAYSSVLVKFDPLATDLPRVMSGVRGAWESMGGLAAPRRRRRVGMRVCFGGENGVDFERAAHELGMRERRFCDAFCKPVYRVAFLGFLAGFPYLVGLPPALTLPRLANPRPRVPAGSVAVAAGQCGIYPRASPGGWRLIGRTMAVLFDPLRVVPALLAPGDAVTFDACERLEDTAPVVVEAASV